MEGNIEKCTEVRKAVGRCGDGRNMRNCYQSQFSQLLSVTVQSITNQGIFNLTTDDYLIPAYVYVGYRSKQPDKETLHDASKKLKENNIDVSQLVEYEYWTDHCQKAES
jgi:hypothetical protein